MNFLRDSVWQIVNTLSVLTIVGQVLALAIIILLILEHTSKKESKFLQPFRRHAFLLSFIVALTAMLGSLYFSEIALWLPCKDCWFQRIFMYPQAVILLIALWNSDRTVWKYIVPLSLIGLWLSTDHYMDQLEAYLTPTTPQEGINMLKKPCDASGVSCAETQIKFAFGYITIPMMCFTASLLTLLGTLLARKKN